MADYNITLTANHQSLTAEYLPLAAESVQYLTAKVVCETEDWTGREIKAMFGQGCTVHGVPVTDGEITAKQQLNLSAGDWRVWLVGNSARDGEVIPRITTNIAHISVAPTGGTEGNPFPVIPPTAEEQLRADMGDLADLTTEDKSSLVAAINEAAANGGSKDAVTYTPQTPTEEQQAQARTNIGALPERVIKQFWSKDNSVSDIRAIVAGTHYSVISSPGDDCNVNGVIINKEILFPCMVLSGRNFAEQIRNLVLIDGAGRTLDIIVHNSNGVLAYTWHQPILRTWTD